MHHHFLPIALLLSLTACDGCETDAETLPLVQPRPTVEAGARARLRWRRFRAVQNDLARALELNPDEVCSEANGAPCATVGPIRVKEYLSSQRGVAPEDAEAECAALQGSASCDDAPYLAVTTPKGVHVLALGGNEPFLGNTFRPLAAPGLTTPLALERMVASACAERVARDANGVPKVFIHVDLSLAEVSSTTPGMAEQTIALYRRLLARDPTAEEVDIVVDTIDGTPPLNAEDAALSSCIAIATTTEVVFQ